MARRLTTTYDPGAPLDARRWWTLSVLCLSLLMVVLGNTVLNIAIPTLMRALDASERQVQWMVDAYGLVFAGLLFTAGALGDRFGRKGALNSGLVVFGLGSACAGLGHGAGQVIAGRAVMGVGAALVMPSTLSILTNVFPPHERARAIGIWAGVAGAAGAIGPISSGILLRHFWWGSIFFINLLVVVVALGAGYFLVPTSRDPDRSPLDPVGAALSIGAVGTLVYGIIEAPHRGWTAPATLASFAVAVAFGLVFARWELHRREPMLDLRYFRRPGFTGGSIAISLMFFGMFGMFFLLTQYMQLVRGWSALSAGVRTLPFALTMMVAAPSSARLAERFGVRNVVSAGVAIAGAGMLILSGAGVATGYPFVVVALVVLATGMGLTMAPSTASIMSSLPLGRAGMGSAMNDTNRELGGALGVAVLGSVLASRYTAELHAALAGLPPKLAEAARSSLGGAIGAASTTGNTRLAAAAKSAFTGAMSLALVIGGVVALVAAVLVWYVLPQHYASEEPDRHRGAEADSTTAPTAPAEVAV